MAYRYETHLHTWPVSKCAKAGVRQTLEFYKNAGYTGVFITDHFIDGNINIDKTEPYPELIRFYFSSWREAVQIGREIGLDVFSGVEMSYKGTDFLVYGLDEQWYLDNPQIRDMKKSQLLTLLAEAGALIVQAHPFREARYIDHIRLFPRHVHAVEICNSSQTEFVNQMGKLYAQSYNLIPFAGSDNHSADARKSFAGMESDTPIRDEVDFVRQVKAGNMRIFTWEQPETE